MPTVLEERLDHTFAALANSTRRAILARLAAGAATVNELAQPFELTLPAISKHIKVLEEAGLVIRGRRAQYRPCALEPESLHAVSTWAEQYRPVWEQRLGPDGRLPGPAHPRSAWRGAEMSDDVVIERTCDPRSRWMAGVDEARALGAWSGPAGAR